MNLHFSALGAPGCVTREERPAQSGVSRDGREIPDPWLSVHPGDRTADHSPISLFAGGAVGAAGLAGCGWEGGLHRLRERMAGRPKCKCSA